MRTLRLPGLLLCALVFAGCAKTEEDTLPFRADALVSGAGGGAGEEPAPGESRFLFFVLDGQGYVASAAGTGARPICDAATLRVDDAGERVLCIPDDTDVPLQLYDVPANEVLSSYPGWRQSNLGTPQLSADGGAVAYPTVSEEGSRVVQVRDDLENLVGETRGSAVVGFANARTLLINRDGVRLWRVGDEESVPVPNNARPVGPEPAGAVFHESTGGFTASFLNAETGLTLKLGDGQVSDVRGRRALVEGVLYDVGDPSYAVEVSLPDLRFNEVLQADLVRSSLVRLEVRPVSAGCDSGMGAPTRTELYDARQDDSDTLYEDADTPHLTRIDGRGRVVLVLDTDRCGRIVGTGRVGEPGDMTDLDDFTDEVFSDGAISPDGRFVALVTAAGVRVVDRPSDTTRPAADGQAASSLQFR